MRRLAKYLSVIVVGFFFAVAAQAKPSADAFGQLPDIYDAAISSDASQVAVLINIEGTYGARVVSLDGSDKKPRAILLGEGIKPGWIKWANDDIVLVSLWESRKSSGTPYTVGGLFALNVATMKGEYLIEARDIFRQYNNNVVDFLEDDPDHILMSFSDDDVLAPDVQKVNVRTGRYKRVKRGRSTIQNWTTDLRGEVRVGQGIRDSSREDEKWVLKIRDSERDKWRGHEEYPGLEAEAGIIGFTENPDELIIRARNGRDTEGLYIYNLAQKAISRTLFHDDTYDAGSVILSGDGKRVIGAKYVSDEVQVELFDGEDSVLERVREQYSSFNVDYIDQSREGNIVLARISNSSDAGALVVIDSQTAKVSRLGNYRSGLPSQEMGLVATIKYKARDGFKIPAYVTLPPNVEGADVKDLPFIVLPHGGPYARSSKRFDYFAQFFASRGYGVLQMNFRGSAGYGQKYKDAGRKNWVLMQEDVEDGARFLIEKGYADPKRLCIAGWSFGGYAALMGAIKNPDIYSCAIAMAAVTDIPDLVSDAKKYRFGTLRANKYLLGGFEDRDAVKDNSPARRAEELKIPLFIAHGTQDQRVHFDQFRRMKRALRKSPADVTYMEFKDEDHFLSDQENRQRFFNGLDKFLLEVNGDSEYAQ